MNDRQLENKVRQDAGKAKKDLTALEEDGVSELSEGFEKLKGDARETVVGAVATVKKEVGHGLSQYNAKAQEVADKVPGGLGEKAARYPWVAITIAFAVGLLLGNFLKPNR
jgi:ElaB/YqjD/DUF883 family membrane-anchored ribosome-binding protein